MPKVISDRLAVYVLYKDPLVEELYPNSAKRETVGWLTKETGGFVCIQNDRTLETSKTSSGSGKGHFCGVELDKGNSCSRKGRENPHCKLHQQ